VPFYPLSKEKLLRLAYLTVARSSSLSKKRKWMNPHPSPMPTMARENIRVLLVKGQSDLVQSLVKAAAMFPVRKLR
jgi:hypothetical protein